MINDCLICEHIHEMPTNKLPNNKQLLEILPLNLIKVTAIDELKAHLDDIQKKRNFIKQGIENSPDLFYDYCIQLKNDVQLKTEQAFEQINVLSTKLIEQIEDYQNELSKFNNNFDSLANFNKIKQELESFHVLKNDLCFLMLVNMNLLA